MRSRSLFAFVICYFLFVLSPVSAQERGPTPASPEQIRAAINKLADLDYDTRMTAARTIRRAPSAQTVPALLQTVTEHADGFVRFPAPSLPTRTPCRRCCRRWPSTRTASFASAP